MAFDTLTAARRLKKVGMEESHAEAVAESLRDAVTGSVATRQDPDAAKAELRQEITAVKAEVIAVEARLREETVAVKAEVTAVKAETRSVKWLMAFVVGLLFVLIGQGFEIL